MAPVRSRPRSIAAMVALLLTVSVLAVAAPPHEEAAAGLSFNDSFASSPMQVTGDYVPLPGDFDCDGISEEIMWYAAGAAPDYFWNVTGVGPVTFDSTPLPVNGVYQPFTGDWDLDDCDDIFWYAPGPAPDYVWYFDGPAPTDYESVQVNVNGTYIPTAIAAAPGVGGIFWYGPGATPEYIWLGNATRGMFESAAGPPVNGTDYRPVRLGNFDETNQGDTMLFHRPGPGQDYVLDDVLWSNQTPDSYPVDIDGSHIPLGVFGDNPFAIMYGPGGASDVLFGETPHHHPCSPRCFPVR